MRIPIAITAFRTASAPSAFSQSHRLSKRPGAVRGVRQRPAAHTPAVVAVERRVTTGSAVCIGVDPDASGAIAVVGLERNADGMHYSVLRVVDMPRETQAVNGKRRKRLKIESALEIVRETVEAANGVRILACLETPARTPINGAFSNQQMGYMFGAWHGMLLANDIPVELVHPLKWKRELNLLAKGKDGSRLMAQQLFPLAEEHLKRKKDHGRAEALLLAAWRLGFRRGEDETVLPLNEALAFIEQTESHSE